MASRLGSNEKSFPKKGKPFLSVSEVEEAGEGELLEQAVAWCRNFCGLSFDAVNDNIEATKTFFGGNSRKISCDYYIDDKGCTPDVFYKLLL